MHRGDQWPTHDVWLVVRRGRAIDAEIVVNVGARPATEQVAAAAAARRRDGLGSLRKLARADCALVAALRHWPFAHGTPPEVCGLGGVVAKMGGQMVLQRPSAREYGGDSERARGRSWRASP